LSNAFLVEYLLTAISSMPDISTSVLKQKKHKTDMCSCYKIAWLCKLQKGCTRLTAASDKVSCAAFTSTPERAHQKSNITVADVSEISASEHEIGRM
jgi:hypothetical protein